MRAKAVRSRSCARTVPTKPYEVRPRGEREFCNLPTWGLSTLWFLGIANTYMIRTRNCCVCSTGIWHIVCRNHTRWQLRDSTVASLVESLARACGSVRQKPRNKRVHTLELKVEPLYSIICILGVSGLLRLLSCGPEAEVMIFAGTIERYGAASQRAQMQQFRHAFCSFNITHIFACTIFTICQHICMFPFLNISVVPIHLRLLERWSTPEAPALRMR